MEQAVGDFDVLEARQQLQLSLADHCREYNKRSFGSGRLAAAALLLAVPCATAAAADRPGSRPCPPEVAHTAQAVATLRQVPGGLSPTCRLIPPAALRRELDRKLRRDLPLPPEEYLRALTRLGFARGEPAALYARLLSFYSSQVLGFYEPAEDALVLVDLPGAGGEQRRMLWAHELAHAAQEKRFALPSRLLAMRGNSDRQRAASAVAEGDALLVMLLLAVPPAEEAAALEVAQRMAAGESLPLPSAPGVPEFFVADLLFPYTEGLAAVLAAYRSGGWHAVDSLLADPPGSTAALRGSRRDPPPATDLPLPPVPPGYREVLTDTVGQWALEYWLRQVLPPEQARALAGGWAGDRLRLVESTADPGRWALAWTLRGHSEAARQALERGMQRAAPRLLGTAPPQAPSPALSWLAAGALLELRAHWPEAAPLPLTAPAARPAG